MRVRKQTVRCAARAIAFWIGITIGAITLLALDSCITPEPYPTAQDSK